MTARLLLHPLCVPPGPRQDLMHDTLCKAGYDDLMIGPASLRGYRELVRKTGNYEYTRMDGTVFLYGEPEEPKRA